MSLRPDQQWIDGALMVILLILGAAYFVATEVLPLFRQGGAQ